MKGLILAGGYGTRLYPLTIDIPKPLLEVAGKSILTRLLEKLEQVPSCNEIYIVTNAKFYEKLESWRIKSKFRFPVSIVNDMTTSNDDRLGAIGDINLVLGAKKPHEDIVIMAGDNLFEFDIRDFVKFSEEKKGLSVALFDVSDKELAKRYGIVSVDKNSKITNFQEKPALPQSTLASTGIYYLPGSKITRIGEYMKTSNSKDAPGNFVRWMSETEGAFGFVFTQGWYDIGDILSYERANAEYKTKKI
ncbi:MAG: nucleotidyltransferase family protein [Candidatus Omnitrophica bacterium]|nr:nucleotidyltransferase family protein [Candidatus Omnitrophota bacterium]